MTQHNFQKYFIYYFILFGIIISLIGASISYILEQNNITKNMDRKSKEIFDIKISTILIPTLSNFDNVTKSLASNKSVLRYINGETNQNKDDINEIFLTVVNSQSEIMQARLIDRNGYEVVRVDRKELDKEPTICADKDLQNKSDRDYFKITSSLKDPTIWHSKIDLNIENGKIEIPYKPTFRVAIPLFDNEKKFNGMVIVNFHLQKLFISIGKSTSFDHYIIDKDQNFIFHPKEELAFNKYKNTPSNFRADFPNGINADGIYSFPIGDILQNDDNAVFVLKTKEIYKDLLSEEKLKTSLIVFVFTIILSFFLSIYLAKTPAKLQKSLLKAHNKLSEFAAIIDRYIITATTKKDSTILDVSSAFVESSGYSKEELIGKKMSIVRDPHSDKTIFQDLWETILSGKTWHGELSNRKKNGEIYWLEQQVIPTLNETKELESFVSIGIDITAKKELEKIASIDKLTSLYNRRMVDEFIKKEVELEKRNPKGLAVIMIDIDHFKAVNDTYGHQVGDEVLGQVARLLLENTRKSDIQGRYGGEEFIIICPQISLEDGFKLAEKIRNEVSLYQFKEVGLKTISLGLALYEDGDTPLSLIKKADLALYNAKGTGRNKTVSYNEIA